MESQQLDRARVCFGAHEEYRVRLDDGGELAAAPAGVLRASGHLPVVGDWVRVRVTPGLAVIHAVEPRKTAFARKAAGKGFARQAIAANIDMCFIVCGLDGDFNPHRIERYLVLACESGAQPVITLNKTDVCADVAGALQTVRAIAPQTAIVAIRAAQSSDALLAWLPAGATAVLLGSSGSGKSTIAAALTGLPLATRNVREADSRGRHTTTASMLLPVRGGAWLIETPGLREVGLVAGDAALDHSFQDIGRLAATCRFADCAHTGEPGCAVQQAMEAGVIAPDRWASYRKLQREARHHAAEASANAQRAQKAKWGRPA